MKILRPILSLLLAVVLLVVGIAGGALFSVRKTYSEENVRHILTDADWAELEIPYKGKTVTLCDYTNDALSALAIPPISNETFNQMIVVSKADGLITDYAAALAEWFFDNGERPMLDSEEISEAFVKAIWFLCFGEDKPELKIPAKTHTITFLSAQTAEEDINDIIDRYQLPPDYAAMLKELAKEFPDADISELMALLEAQQNGSASDEGTPEDGFDLPFLSELIPDGFDLSAFLDSLTGGSKEDAEPDSPVTDDSVTDDSVTDDSVTDDSVTDNSVTDGDLTLPGSLESLLIERIIDSIAAMPDLKDAIHELDNGLDKVEPFKPIFSFDTLRSLAVCAAVLILLLLLLNITTPSLGLPWIGVFSALGGLLLLALPRAAYQIPDQLFLTYEIPKSTFFFVADPLLSNLDTMGTVLAAGGGCILILGIVIGSARKAFSRRK